MRNERYEFDFAISYAGENEEIAQELCRLLQESGAKVFFAKEQVGKLWGTNLLDTLRRIFQEKSRFCIMLISEAYVRKYWPLNEWNYIKERLKLLEEDILLPIRIDPVDFPGLPTEISYISLQYYTLDEIAAFAIDKLELPGIEIPIEEQVIPSDQSKSNMVWSRTGALFWISSNLQWTYIQVMQGGSPEDIGEGLQQCCYYAKQLNMGEGIPERLETLLKDASHYNPEGDWNPDRRGRFAYEIRTIFEFIAILAEENEKVTKRIPDLEQHIYQSNRGMHLFINYARIDRPRCKQIIDLLDMYDIWYDQRLHIGQKWWDEIVKRLHWCDGLVYLMSAASLASHYCTRELEIAISLKKKIFPVVIEPGIDVPSHLSHIQYVDATNGLDSTMAKSLLTSIFIAERQLKHAAVAAVGTSPIPVPEIVVPTKNDGKTILEDAVHAFRQSDYDKAAFRLKQVLASGYTSRFINIHSMLREAEAALERQAYVREAQREYAPIALLMKDEATRSLGCTAFRAFQAMFPNYDPDNLKAIYEQTILTQPSFDLNSAMPLLEWRRIPAGPVTIERSRSRKMFEIAKFFFMSKYPVTNAQFHSFIDAPDGYENPVWWQSSLEMRRWHADHPKAIEAAANQPTHPRVYVCWYEATAFCQWLSYKTGWTVKLPTEQQWQRAGQGDNGWRFPWGRKFDSKLANTKETEAKGSTPVTQYPKSASPYGVCDLLGNVWEWCSNGTASGEITDVTVDILRVVRGGSFMSPKKRTNINFHYFLNPLYRYQSIGFRIVCETGAEFLGV